MNSSLFDFHTAHIENSTDILYEYHVVITNMFDKLHPKARS